MQFFERMVVAEDLGPIRTKMERVEVMRKVWDMMLSCVKKQNISDLVENLVHNNTPKILQKRLENFRITEENKKELEDFNEQFNSSALCNPEIILQVIFCRNLNPHLSSSGLFLLQQGDLVVLLYIATRALNKELLLDDSINKLSQKIIKYLEGEEKKMQTN